VRSHAESAARTGARQAALGIAVNTGLAITKAVAGILGNSYALIADAIESASDILSSLIVLFGVRMAGKPADTNHPYGHGKFEPLAALAVALILFGAAILIAVESTQEILTPHHGPEPFTLLVLLAVIAVKETLFRNVLAASDQIGSSALKSDAWHHRADVISSSAAFVGISTALVGGPGYESADDFAALIAATLIAINAALLIKPALLELIDTAPNPEIAKRIREIAEQVPGVLGTHKCHVRKLGFDHFVDLDVLCDPEASIRQGHEVAHNVGEAIHRELPQISKVLVHVEPADDYGRRSREPGY
jgi:cation diffusion facilitator family transporter